MQQSSEKKFLKFFFKRVKLNIMDNSEAWPYASPCGDEMNYIRCDDLPVVFQAIVYGMYNWWHDWINLIRVRDNLTRALTNFLLNCSDGWGLHCPFDSLKKSRKCKQKVQIRQIIEKKGTKETEKRPKKGNMDKGGTKGTRKRWQKWQGIFQFNNCGLIFQCYESWVVAMDFIFHLRLTCKRILVKQGKDCFMSCWLRIEHWFQFSTSS